MGYRVEVAERPDGLYALSNGRIFGAQRSTTDGTVLLVVPEGEQAPEDFDVESQGRPAKIVPAAEVEHTFALHTYCLFDDEPFRIEPHSDEAELTLRWAGNDEQLATELGITGLATTTSDPETLSALWQERHDFAGDATTRSEPGRGDVPALLRAIGQTLRGFLPPGWQRVAAQLRQIGDYSELEVRAVAEDVIVSLSAPPQLGQLFTQLRSAMYEPDNGTWFQGTLTLDSESNFDFDYNTETEPAWRLPPEGRTTARSYDVELEYFPRKQVPSWLAAKAGLPLDVRFRQARVVDSHTEGEKPVVNRPPVPQEEVSRILGYLYRAPVVVNRARMLPDIFVPGQNVPDAFHTDGTWIWPAAVPHYLRTYGVPPERELLDHIRASAYQLPYVGKRLRMTAEADVLGAPYPPQTPEDLPRTDPVSQIERGNEPGKPLRASDTLQVLHTRLAEHGVAESAYRIGAALDGAWCLRRTPQGWEVAFHTAGAPVEPRYFPRVAEAAEALLGALLLFPGRRDGEEPDDAEGPESSATATDWAILPLRGEPPLTFYRGKRMVTLATGSVVQRFGNENGNLVHPDTTRFFETSLTFEREFDRRVYRVRKPVQVLTGVFRPWGSLPGGGIAYLLPRPLGRHVETGALERLNSGPGNGVTGPG